MAISERLRQLLDASQVRYTAMKHPVVYTAQEIAAAQHVPGRQLAKSVLVKTDRGPVLAVLPAIQLIDLKQLKVLAGAKTATIAKELDVKAQFPDVEAGAMSPFGNLYQVPVVVERALGDADDIVFNAGSHTDTLKMRYSDFVTLVKPTVGSFGRSISGKAKAKPRARPASAKKRRPTTRARKAAKKSTPRRSPHR